MLERYYIRPDTIDRIRASWLGEAIERYVTWLTEKGYAARNVFRRVPILVQFAEFARARGAKKHEDLPALVKPFTDAWFQKHGRNSKTERARKKVAYEARNPIQQMLRLILEGFTGGGRSRWAREPFRSSACGFFEYLRKERGLRETSVAHYRHYLQRFEDYLTGIDLAGLHELSPVLISSFIAQSSRSMGMSARKSLCSALRVFIRYLWREQLIHNDLSGTIESPKIYRLSKIPRSITWDEVRNLLSAVDRRTPCGKRDYAILLLLVTYGLRAREVAELRLDDIDWERERLLVPERKAGHSTAYPLSSIVGQAIIEYLPVRPKTEDRHLFFRALAPYRPYTYNGISGRVSHYLRRAGIPVSRPGSHTLRHTCVQRLLDSGFALKVIGDYVGHRSAEATKIYTKVAIEELREIALGNGEDLS
jgi:site-specific recombinase XerD